MAFLPRVTRELRPGFWRSLTFGWFRKVGRWLRWRLQRLPGNGRAAAIAVAAPDTAYQHGDLF